ncbi:Gfo/Idh/MocA family oxidoreductase [Fictibacillus enclensis]|uniref:Gfo/Idh/MocA family protein n=1 Tax=Fictibacillus enclensis TaxID=1017270 RepID=UPI0025A111AD|nr:Gfo/Idh/MocA family oxidoreductase [Fictibacillus enclensis]MDM5338606.1 Gfo/Idh/MocA family oxidoreductase [Fictibacillus enclensis]
MEKIRIIQVGSGGFGQSWLEVAMKYEHVELVAVVDMMEENLKQAKQITGLPGEMLLSTIDEALGEIEADAVLIVTPPQTHKELAIKAIQQGFHVMMEKPLAHTLEEAKELLDFKQNHHKQLMVSQNYRWNRPIQTVKQLLDAGEIGKVEWMNYSFQRASHFGGWRDRYDHILLEDMSIHHFDLMRYLLNKNPVEVYAQSYRPSWSWFQGNPNAHVSIAFEDDVHVSYAGSWVTKGKETPWNGEFRLVGEKGAIELIEDKVTLYDSNNEARNVPIVNLPYDDRTLSLDHFVQSIIIGNQAATSIEDNIKSYELTCAAIESAVTHKVVKLPLSLVQN